MGIFVKRDMPADFAEVAPGKSEVELREIYGAGQSAICRWRKEAGIAPKPRPRLRSLPDDFAQWAPTESNKGLSIRYSTSEDTITRWRRETGIKSASMHKFSSKPPRRAPMGSVKVIAPHVGEDDSVAARAKRHLQRNVPVWRCDPDGRFDHRGTHYRVGAVVRTEEGMIDRAKRHGFDPNEWSRLAA